MTVKSLVRERSSLSTTDSTESRYKIREVRDQLRKQAFLYESPQDFCAGVEATLNAFLRDEISRSF